ncbi:MAG: hypothetical protein HC871_09245 [Rhizobiales bacterium]|nr:hypothetical protein [Hyphomicrobiales bacterium]
MVPVTAGYPIKVKDGLMLNHQFFSLRAPALRVDGEHRCMVDVIATGVPPGEWHVQGNRQHKRKINSYCFIFSSCPVERRGGA